MIGGKRRGKGWQFIIGALDAASCAFCVAWNACRLCDRAKYICWIKSISRVQLLGNIRVHCGVLLHLHCPSLTGALQAGQTSVPAAEQRRMLDRLRNQAESMRERLEEVGQDRAALRQEVMSLIMISAGGAFRRFNITGISVEHL